MRVALRSARTTLVSSGLLALAALAPVTAVAGGSVGVLVLKEHGVGSAAQAQPYLDKLMGVAAQQNGWPGAKGQYQTTRSGAEAYIQSDSPHYGVLSLAAFLAMRDKYKLEAIGQAVVAGGGGEQYFIVSKSAADLAGCKGKRLVSNHADDPRFIEHVVFAKAFKLSDFTLVTVMRPSQPIHKVIGDEAECALIDDAQHKELKKVEGGGAVKTVWSSAKLPPMAVVAFPSAPAAEKTTFQNTLSKLCPSAGDACKEVGLTELKSAPASAYAAVIVAYQ